MATEVHEFPVTIPAGTPLAAPLVFNLAMPVRIVEEIQIQVPPGPRGEVGFAVGASGLAVLPYEPSTFVVTDNEVVKWALEGQIESGAWQLIAYNTGAFNHTLYVRFLTRLPPSAPAAPAVTLIPISALDSPPSPANGGPAPGVPAPPPLPPPARVR